MNPGTPRPDRRLAEDRPIRRTWWLLSGGFLLLALVTGFRALTSGDVLDWIPLGAVVFAVVAAALHRNAVAGLEARGRAEAENFARILQGLSRSVSVDAIVGAIVDDLAEGTGADHVVVVRRRPEGGALEATLVSRRPGVPSSSTLLPLTDLESPIDREPPPAIRVPIDPEGNREASAARAGLATAGVRNAERQTAGGGGSTAGGGGSTAGGGDSTAVRDSTAGGVAAPASVRPSTAARDLASAEAPASVRASTATRASTAIRPPASVRASTSADVAAVEPRRSVGPAVESRRSAASAARPGGARERTAAWVSAVLDDLGIGQRFRSRGLPLAARSEVLGGGSGAAVTRRVADRVRGLYGLSHTIAAPLRTEAGVIGAIVLSRRDREPWPDAARRLLEGAAVEAAAAMARAYSHREATAHASTDPLTGLPNRRYFDEFCGLLARRRRAGDAVAVLMIDIDRFKVLNDSYGHPVGDEVLRAVAGAIVTAVREEDVPARVGGEEFAVLLRNPGREIAIEVGERVRQAVRAVDLDRYGIAGVSVSVGVASAQGQDEPIAEIVERADRALLRAKRDGRDRVVAAT